ncbi:MAG TPA: glycosyltransferase [Candidatus Saccharimonadales bacterium]|nr:glycosyltransferase [Candidatus Saccharimonadales bacterium]
MPAPRVAIVHDWLTNQGGAERVVMALHKAYPEAPIYTSVYEPKTLPEFNSLDVNTSFLQHWPFSRSKHQLYPLLRTIAFESFDFSDYDVVISSCSAEAKGIITGPQTLHICYLYTPTRYYWSGYEEYMRDPGFGILSPLVRLIMPRLVASMRRWDLAAASRPDTYVTQSRYVADRIAKYYGRKATPVIPPPTNIDRFSLATSSKAGFLVVSRLVPYKRVDLAIEACNRLGLPLTVIGGGTELARLQGLAGPTVQVVGRRSDAEIAKAYAQAAAFIFTAEEDYGITPLEAMAAGTPVIAFGNGGATETVIDGVTGSFFAEQTVESLVQVLKNFDSSNYDAAKIRAHAATYDESIFIKKIKKFIDEQLKEYRKS